MNLRAMIIFATLITGTAAGAAVHTVRNTDADGDGSLAAAVDDADAGDSIVFASGVRGTIELAAPLDVSDDLTIRGPGAGILTVRGQGDRVLETRGVVTVSGVTLAGGEIVVEAGRGKLTLLDCAVRDASGAGVHADAGRVTLTRTLVAGNGGAGVHGAGAAVACANSTIAENGGAGVRIDEGSLEAANCTIAHNRGAGVQNDGGEATLRNSIVARNQRACNGTVTSGGHNLVDDTTCGFHAAGDVQSDDARIASLAPNGGPTETVALTGGSPAIDGGDPSGCGDPSGGLLTIDQRGTRRPAGGRCDIGAFEQPVAVQGTEINRIVALVDGDPITALEVDRFAASDPRIAQSGGVDRNGLLEIVVTQRLLAKEIEAQGISVPDAEIDRSIAGIRERNGITDEQLDAALAQQGLTRERYRQQIKEELQRAQLINREIRGKVSVSPEEIERYHRAQKGDGDEATAGSEETDEAVEETARPSGGEMTISHIVLRIPEGASEDDVAAVVARAEKIHEQLDDGADFAEVAGRESEDGAAKAGGKLGTFKPGEMREELEEAVANLDPGEHSAPVRSEMGIHIVRLDARAGEAAAEEPDEDADTAAASPSGMTDSEREEIKEKLYAQALEERYMRWMKEDLRQRHMVEILP